MKEFIYVFSAILSVILIIVGMLWYSKETKKQNAKPNLVVMLLWTLIAIINAVSYYLIVTDNFKSSLVIIAVVVNIYVLVIIIVHKNYILLKRDIFITIIGVLIIACLLVFTNMKQIHIIMQILNTIVYIPLIWGICDRKGIEPFGPWFIILIATVFNLIVVLINYSNYWSLIQPLRSLFLQVIVLVLIRYKEVKNISFGEIFYLPGRWVFLFGNLLVNFSMEICILVKIVYNMVAF